MCPGIQLQPADFFNQCDRCAKKEPRPVCTSIAGQAPGMRCVQCAISRRVCLFVPKAKATPIKSSCSKKTAEEEVEVEEEITPPKTKGKGILGALSGKLKCKQGDRSPGEEPSNKPLSCSSVCVIVPLAPRPLSDYVQLGICCLSLLLPLLPCPPSTRPWGLHFPLLPLSLPSKRATLALGATTRPNNWASCWTPPKKTYSCNRLVLWQLWLGASLESELSSARAGPGRLLALTLRYHSFGNRAGSELAPNNVITLIFIIYYLNLRGGWLYILSLTHTLTATHLSTSHTPSRSKKGSKSNSARQPSLCCSSLNIR